jgi:hypothetical protein
MSETSEITPRTIRVDLERWFRRSPDGTMHEFADEKLARDVVRHYGGDLIRRTISDEVVKP